MCLGGGALDAVGKRESELRWSFLGVLVGVVLLGSVTLAVLVRDGSRAEDLERACTSAVTAGHVLIHHVDGTSELSVSVLTIHIRSAASGVVFQPDAEVLDISGVLLNDLLTKERGEGVRWRDSIRSKFAIR